MQRSAQPQYNTKYENHKISSTVIFAKMSKEEDDRGVQQLKDILLPRYEGNETFKKRQMKRNDVSACY
jgi:hypothetical protein